MTNEEWLNVVSVNIVRFCGNFISISKTVKQLPPTLSHELSPKLFFVASTFLGNIPHHEEGHIVPLNVPEPFASNIMQLSKPNSISDFATWLEEKHRIILGLDKISNKTYVNFLSTWELTRSYTISSQDLVTHELLNAWRWFILENTLISSCEGKFGKQGGEQQLFFLSGCLGEISMI